MPADDNPNLAIDEAARLHGLLKAMPNARIEVVTNSVLSSDNFFTQSIIDMETAPRMLLTPDLQSAWQSGLRRTRERTIPAVGSDTWHEQVNHPQIFIYEIGRGDSAYLDKGTTHYGKPHAKFIVGENIGFVGTPNFDYRWRLFNSEMGFFFDDPELRAELIQEFEELKNISYRWGTSEWLQMRSDIMASGGGESSYDTAPASHVQNFEVTGNRLAI